MWSQIIKQNNKIKERNDSDSFCVVVRRQWNNPRVGYANLSDLERFHWSYISGGVNAPAPRAFIHAYVYCNKIRSDAFPHSCLHGEGPHYIKVCIVKKDQDPKVWRRILELVKK